MEPLSTIIVLALIIGWAGIGYWAHEIGRPPIPFVLLAMIGSPILAGIVLLIIGPSPEYIDKQLEEGRARGRQVRLAEREQQAFAMKEEMRARFEDDAYAQAWSELEKNEVNHAAMARATETSDGNTDRARSLYVRYRVSQILDERLGAMECECPTTVVEHETPNLFEIADATGRRRTLTRGTDGNYSLKTISGGEKVFATIEDARKYLRG
ncbi:hypothetical protein [Alterinioella nitratireducens]|uniref:hypothetical protein n=1 Tax=Alterinioella nitratireducens TaxID=2735915 RepID=UPI00155450E9|nr:hypothetical protein [Alterinioella nitratireducens]NPD19964.1 hypothetical protein [Alterinioella nitratireducens]